MQVIIGSVIVVIIARAVPMFHNSLNVYMMGFFRDISRVKARKRRMSNDAVISASDIKAILFDEEDDPLQDVVDKIMSEDDANSLSANFEDLPIYTREELYELGSGDNGALLLSIFGRVYDVSAGEKYYGDEGKYHLFAGRDITFALSTGCLKESCLGPKNSADSLQVFELNDKTTKEGKKWVAFFETHDSYKHVGFLKDGQSIEDLIDSLLEEESSPLCKKGGAVVSH